MSTARDHLILLSDTLSVHAGITHWAVSMRITTKGNFIDRLKKGGDCRTATYESALSSFSRVWPTDLEWPDAVYRPSKDKSVQQ